eukprot:1392297-Amorphochlora_amoeboformis.AAC.1
MCNSQHGEVPSPPPVDVHVPRPPVLQRKMPEVSYLQQILCFHGLRGSSSGWEAGGSVEGKEMG